MTEVDGPSGETEVAHDDGATRFGFTAFLSAAWRLFSSRALVLITIFCAAHVVVGLVLALTGALVLPLAILLAVVLPVVAGSIAVGVASSVLLEPGNDARSAISIGVGRVSKNAEAWKLALVAAGVALVAVVLLQQYGFLVLPLLYGPPIAMQLVVGEELSLRDALIRARQLLTGNWRQILYLLNIAIALGLLGFMLVSGLSTQTDLDATATSIASSVLLTLIVGTSSAYLAAAQVALYKHLAERDVPLTSLATETASDPATRD